MRGRMHAGFEWTNSCSGPGDCIFGGKRFGHVTEKSAPDTNPIQAPVSPATGSVQSPLNPRDPVVDPVNSKTDSSPSGAHPVCEKAARLRCICLLLIDYSALRPEAKPGIAQ